MSTFLQLAQKVAAESGTISGTQPTTCQNQVGRLLKIVNWVSDSWNEIQNRHASWRWMRVQLPATCLTVANTPRYTAAAWGITNLAEWIIEPHVTSLYNVSIGVADEGEITFMEYIDYWRGYDRGLQTPNRPGFYTIDPQDQFCLGPIPDQIYQVRGMYRTTPQILSADTDVPACPARFHDSIVWLAVLRLCQHDEAGPVALAAAQLKYSDAISALERDQLPTWEAYTGPLA